MDIEWNDGLATGIEDIDSQHKKLIDKINELMLSMGQGQEKGKEAVLDTLAFLEDYAQVHFRTEEGYMEKAHYPDYEKHRDEHSLFIKDLSDLKELILKHDKPTFLGLQSNMGHSLYTWLTKHIGEMDKVMGEYLLKEKLTQRPPDGVDHT